MGYGGIAGKSFFVSIIPRNNVGIHNVRPFEMLVMIGFSIGALFGIIIA